MPLRVYFDKHRNLEVDATLYAPDGRGIAAAVKHNDFSLNRTRWDKNWDGYGLEIVDEQQRPILQIDREDVDILKVGGVFYTSQGGMTVINDDGIHSVAPFLVASTPIVYPRPMFTYPSHGNEHKRVKQP